MRKVLIVASAAALAAIGGVAFAQHSGGHSLDRLFQHDADRDGALSLQEFNAAHAAMFAHIDSNSDGRLTRAELEAAHQRHEGNH